MYKEHIWYDQDNDKIYVLPFTPVNFTIPDIVFFYFKPFGNFVYIDEL